MVVVGSTVLLLGVLPGGRDLWLKAAFGGPDRDRLRQVLAEEEQPFNQYKGTPAIRLAHEERPGRMQIGAERRE